MILSAVAVMLQAAPTLAMVESLPPGEAGGLVLAGKDHGPIAAIVVPRLNDLPPGFAERQLVERPVAEKGACVRKRWTVTFARKAGETESRVESSDIWAGIEIALPGLAGCPDDDYLRLDPGLKPIQALPALKHLDALRRGDAQASFTCSDQTTSDLCADPKALRQKLAALSPWALTRQNGQMVFWLGVPGEVVTELRYSTDRLDQVTVSRKIPAPF